jgi:hypothetical protein
MPDLSKTSLTWNDLTIGAGTPYRMLTLEGWEELPASRYDKQTRTNAHGAHPTPVYSDERIVGVEGYCWTGDDRDQLLADLRAYVTFDDDPDEDTEPLAVTVAGKTLTAGAQLIAAVPKLTRGEWGVGKFGWLLQWRCPDPRRYGAPQTASTGLPTAGGGLAYPLAYPLDYGPVGVTGRITLTNPGSAAAPILLAVTGGHDVGFEVSAVETGQRLTYPVPVPAGQVIELDTADGSVLVEGTASRRGNLSHADWMLVPRRDPKTGVDGVLTLQYTSLGGIPDPNASLAATVSETNW